MTLKEKSWRILYFSDQYITMVTNTLEMAIKSGNPAAIISGNIISEEYFISKTKYCDYSIIISLLFLFYHWIELILKGFLLELVKEDADMKKISHHDVIKLLEEFKNNFSDEKDIINFLEKYTRKDNMPTLLKVFFDKNGLSVKDYYSFFKYPFDRNFNIKYDYSNIQYTDEEGLAFFKDLLKDINKYKKSIVKLGRDLNNK
jgi:hypothetical protein